MMRVVAWLLGVVLLAVITFGAGALWWWHDLNQPYSHNHPEAIVSINRGASTEQILAQLKAQGILASEWPLRLYLRLRRGRINIKAGDYRFPSPISSLAVLDTLEKGGTEHARLTVVEGWSRFEIARALRQIPSFKLKSDKEAMALLTDISPIATLDPGATTLEGYLYPDTYFIQADTSARDLVLQMVKRFKTVYSKQLENDVVNSGSSLHTVVTIASIVETEAKIPPDRPLVASVIFNRLRKGMKLSMDSTIVYACKIAGTWKDDGKIYQSYLDLNSPYNSRMYKGLPPGPVCSPGLSSLEAALHPARSDYIYYVREPSRNDGAHNFYSNVADFEKGVENLRKWEKEQLKKANK